MAKALPRDADGDGWIFEGTPREQRVGSVVSAARAILNDHASGRHPLSGQVARELSASLERAKPSSDEQKSTMQAARTVLDQHAGGQMQLSPASARELAEALKRTSKNRTASGRRRGAPVQKSGLASLIDGVVDSASDYVDAEVDWLQKSTIKVSGYTQTRNGRTVHVSAYSRKSLLKRVQELSAGDSFELPDGRRIGKDSKGRLVVVNRGKARGRRHSNASSAVDDVRTKSARDASSEKTLGGAKRHTDVRRAEREDGKAKQRAKQADNDANGTPGVGSAVQRKGQDARGAGRITEVRESGQVRVKWENGDTTVEKPSDLERPTMRDQRTGREGSGRGRMTDRRTGP